jgi:glycosyltransferase involved in cell wall biosynthesis
MAGPGKPLPGPELSVVLSTLGVLDGYSSQDAPPQSFELLVVTDLADPDPGAVGEAIGARGYPVRRLTGHIPGLSANRNTGWHAARTPLVLFTDNDTIPRPRLVSEHVAWHRRNRAEEVGVLGHVRWAPELRVTPFMRWLDHGIQFDYPRIEGTEAGWGRFYGANVSVKRSFLARVGDFDEDNLPYGYEDLDWSYRASMMGSRLLYAHDAVVDHLRHDMTLEFWKKRVRRIAVAERQFTRLHPEITPWFHRLFSHAIRQPAVRGRGVRLAPFVPRWVPWLGPRVWSATDLAYRQALAPHFLAAWDETAGVTGAGAAQPDLSELEESSSGSSPGGPQ